MGYEPRTIEAGGWRVTALSDGFLRLDGGSMWGVVPAALWRKLTPPAADNTIRLALRPFLLEQGEHVVVVEPGVGNRWEPKWQRIYGIEPETTVLESLAACGHGPDDVTHVILTHAHWDHCGAAVREAEGVLAPTFPRARHFLPASEFEAAHRGDDVRRASYRAEDVDPLRAAGLLETWSGALEPLPGLHLVELGGHSDGVSLVRIGEGAGAAVFWSDVVPTAHHIQPPYIMAYDIDVVRSHEVRAEWLARAAEQGWTGLFFHDEHTAFARLERDGRRYVAVPIAGAPR